MCGILGVVSGEKGFSGLTPVTKFMKDGCHVGMLRGRDSTGMFQVDHRNIIDVHKLPMTGDQFVETKRASAMMGRSDAMPITILHHRAATKGAVNYENSHPFTHEDGKRMLVGVHNGSLTTWENKYDGLEFNVDSDYAFYRIFKDGNEAFKEIYGAYAFIWWESDGKLRMACNGQRELHFAFIHKKNAMLVASEEGMLWWLADRNDIKIDAILRPNEHKLLTFDPKGDLRDFADEDIPKPHYKVTASGGSYRQGNFQRPQQIASSAGEETASTGVTGEFSIRVGQEVNFYPTMKASDSKQLVGQVQLPTKEDGKYTEVDAIMSCKGPSLYSNIKANNLDFIIANVRSISSHKVDKRDSVLLLLTEPTLTVGREETTEQETDDDWAEGPAGRSLGITEFKLLTRNGCVVCTKDISWAAAKKGTIGWETHSQEAICPVCMANLEKA